LRNLDTEDPDYASPGSSDSYGKCINGVKANWDKYEKEPGDAEQEIARRMGAGEYRLRALGIMAAASQHENATFWLDRYLQVR
jgi:hypothetical protein